MTLVTTQLKPPAALLLPNLSHSFRRRSVGFDSLRAGRHLQILLQSKNFQILPYRRAVEGDKPGLGAETEAEATGNGAQEEEKNVREMSEVGAEIKKAMEERKSQEGQGVLSINGVAEEVREIEWPAFGKVLGITWVVLAVIAGSTVVLLTVNAVLAELSDRVFGGRGLQDFFS